MCLILFAWNAHPDYRLIVAANRDEFYNRPTAPAAFWEEQPNVLAGRDLKAGGTWMGITRNGRFAAITNFRDLQHIKPDAPSRGELVSNFLTQATHPQDYLLDLQRKASLYNGFNLLVGNRDELWYYSNVEDRVRPVEPGVHGLSNHLLDTPWPKVVRGKEELQTILARPAIDSNSVLERLKNTAIAADKDLPETGVGLDWERILSPMFISSQDYGTRSSTAVLVRHNGSTVFSERTYLPPALYYKDRNFQLDPTL